MRDNNQMLGEAQLIRGDNHDTDRAAAVRKTADMAHDRADLEMLLDMLGLNPKEARA